VISRARPTPYDHPLRDILPPKVVVFLTIFYISGPHCTTSPSNGPFCCFWEPPDKPPPTKKPQFSPNAGTTKIIPPYPRILGNLPDSPGSFAGTSARLLLSSFSFAFGENFKNKLNTYSPNKNGSVLSPPMVNCLRIPPKQRRGFSEEYLPFVWIPKSGCFFSTFPLVLNMAISPAPDFPRRRPHFSGFLFVFFFFPPVFFNGRKPFLPRGFSPFLSPFPSPAGFRWRFPYTVISVFPYESLSSLLHFLLQPAMVQKTAFFEGNLDFQHPLTFGFFPPPSFPGNFGPIIAQCTTRL